MRLVSPSVGECADRLTILELKIEFGILREIDVSHFEEEYSQILKYVDFMLIPSKEYQELQDVNRGLWELEGRVRHEDWWKDPRLGVDILKKITLLNDKRAELVNQIDGTQAKEKLY